MHLLRRRWRWRWWPWRWRWTLEKAENGGRRFGPIDLAASWHHLFESRTRRRTWGVVSVLTAFEKTINRVGDGPVGLEVRCSKTKKGGRMVITKHGQASATRDSGGMYQWHGLNGFDMAMVWFCRRPVGTAQMGAISTVCTLTSTRMHHTE